MKASAGGAYKYANLLVDSLGQLDESADLVVLDDFPRRAALIDSMRGRLRHRKLNHNSNTTFHDHSVSVAIDVDKGCLSNYDIIHLHSFNNFLSYGQIRDAVSEGQKVVWTFHNLWGVSGGCLTEIGNTCVGYLKGCEGCPHVKKHIRKDISQNFSQKIEFLKELNVGIIPNSEWTQGALSRVSQKFGLKTFNPIPPHLDPALTSWIRGFKSNHERCKGGRIQAVMSANGVNQVKKGIVEFLQFFELRPEIAKSIKFTVIGSGDLPPFKNIDVEHFNYIHSRSRYCEIIARSDVYVSASKMETFGAAVLEAQALGVPVVGFDVGGIKEAVYPFWRKNLVKVDDWEELTKRILSIPFEPEYRMPDASIWAIEQFSPKLMAKKQISIYDTISR